MSQRRLKKLKKVENDFSTILTSLKSIYINILYILLFYILYKVEKVERGEGLLRKKDEIFTKMEKRRKFFNFFNLGKKTILNCLFLDGCKVEKCFQSSFNLFSTC